MPSLMQPDAERLNQLHQSVTVYNMSDETFTVDYNKGRYQIPPKHKRNMPALVAYHIFGDPTVKAKAEKDPEKNGRAWEIELRRVRNQYGDPGSRSVAQDTFKRLIESGKLFCREFGTNAPGYYNKISFHDVKMFEGEPISPSELQSLAANPTLPPQGPLQSVSDEEVLEITQTLMGVSTERASTGGTGRSESAEFTDALVAKASFSTSQLR